MVATKDEIERARLAHNAGAIAGKTDSLIMVEFARDEIERVAAPLEDALEDAQRRLKSICEHAGWRVKFYSVPRVKQGG